MSISVINGGIAHTSGAFFRVLLVLAIVLQASLFVHYHATAPAPQTQAITQQ